MTTSQLPVSAFAQCRAGDKTDTLNIAVVARDAPAFAHLEKHLTQALVAATFSDRTPRAVTRYVLPNLTALNFVLEGALDGGVNSALHLDRHGKTLSSRLADLMIPAMEDGDG